MAANRERTSSTGSARAILSFLLVIGASFSVLSCKNALEEMGKKDTDAALLYDARRQIDNQDYAAAIASIQRMTTAGQAERETKALLASAYAGECGLDLVDLANQISNASGTTFFNIMLNAYKANTATETAECKAAETALLSIDTDAANRTADENVLTAFVEFAKIGSILADKADANDDGVSEWASGDSCSSAKIDDTSVGELGTGITIAMASLEASGSSAASGTISTITSMCTDIDNALKVYTGDPTYSGFCTKTDATTWSPEELKAIRSLTQSNEIGLATCNNTLDNCVCP